MLQTIARRPLVASLCIVGFILSPVLLGYAPVGGDPELMYQPIKAELARALSAGRLPFWSDRFGLGIPLVAESHVAAFYPPNWLLYRFLDVSIAYRLTMWLHMLGLVAATFAYARALEIGEAGAALAAIVFTLCGFQAVHAVHEPFYHLMLYLPLCLLLANGYVQSGRLAWLGSLAITFAAQLLLGHFQIQMWTAGLVLLTGGWRTLVQVRGSMRQLGRLVGLGTALGWGAAIGWVQLRLTWELTGVSGFVRPPQFLSNFLFPPAHWAQFGLPEVFLGRPLGAGDIYWGHRGTTPGEACAYVGVVPLILALIGMVAPRRDRTLTLWRLVVPVSLALATMPGWWPDGFYVLLQLPGVGWFRAPARYTLLSSLGLALLAGQGFDHTLKSSRFWAGMAFAILIGTGAWVWSVRYWMTSTEFQTGLGSTTFSARFAMAGLAWILGIAAIIAWRRERVRAWVPISIAVVELSWLFFVGPVWWRWEIPLPQASPVLRDLANLRAGGLIAGRLLNLPVTAGQTAGYPNLGITPPPPNYLLEPSISPPGQNTESERRWQRRFGVTHGVWSHRDDVRGTEPVAEVDDPALDEVMSSVPNLRDGGLGPWKIVKNRDAFPPAWAVCRVEEAASWGRLYTELSRADHEHEAWFLTEDNPPSLPIPVATAARVQSWDKREAVVEHDGSCILIMRRTYYPGWSYQINGGPLLPVLKVDGGLQGVLITGSGTSRVTVTYRPTGLSRAMAVSLTALTSAVVIVVISVLKSARSDVRRDAR